MAAIFGRGIFFFENWQEYISKIPLKILTKSLYLTQLRRQKQICVLHFPQPFQNGRHFWGENLDEIALSPTVKEIDIFMLFCYVAYYSITREVKAISINNNTKQAIEPINLYTKLYKNELNMFPFKE